MPRASWTALVAVAACLLSAAAPALAADGDLDPEFDYDGVQSLGDGSRGSIALQDDGRIVVAGDDDPHVLIYRLTSTGGLDESFDDDGVVRVSADELHLGGVAVQPDGKVVAAYTRTHEEGGDDAIVQRFTVDGDPDLSFGAPAANGSIVFDYADGSDSRIEDLTLQPDGRIIVAGSSDGDFAAARLTTAGQLDASFSGDGRTVEDLGADENAASVTLDRGGRIVLAGSSNPGGASRFAALALLGDGSRAIGFGPNSDGTHIADLGAGSFASDVIATPDGGLLLTGGAAGPGDRDVALLKLDDAGRADAGFSGDGRQYVELGGIQGDAGSAAATTIDGKLAVAAVTDRGGDKRLGLVKLTPDGELDPSFGDGGRRVHDRLGFFVSEELLRQRNGRLLVGGGDGAGIALARVADSLPVATLTAPTIDEGRVAPFAVTLNKTAGYPVSMSFVTGDGSANAGEDYTGRRGTLTIQAGQRAGVIAVSTTLDRLYEAADEDFRIELDDLAGATFGVRIDHATLRNVLRRGRCANTVIGRRGTDVITGSPAGDRIRGRADADVLFGLGGDDCVLGERGGDQIRGGDGDDVLEGGSGDDEMKGEDGKDRIVGGRGRNRYSGGAGNDRIYARNGRAEIVECGPGRDYAKVDRTDKLRRCERVARSRG